MSPFAAIILSFIAALVFYWPLWLALAAAQGFMLYMGVDIVFRWLPAALAGLGFVFAVVYPLLHA